MWLKIYCFVFLLCIFPLTAKQIDVEYVLDGKKYQVTGSGENGVYVFNPKGKPLVKLATLDWPPYIAENICQQGWVQQFTIALLAHHGFKVSVEFLPWARAVHMVELGKLDILYPEYFIEETAPSDVIKGKLRRDNLALSSPFPGGSIAFIKRKGESDLYKGKFHNLKSQKIGVVRGYQNTPEFDDLLDANFFEHQLARDDLQNVRMLLAKRVNLIIGDPLVIQQTIMNAELATEVKQNMLAQIETVSPIIQYQPLFFAISKKNSNWPTLLNTVNEGLDTFLRFNVVHTIRDNIKKTCFTQP